MHEPEDNQPLPVDDSDLSSQTSEPTAEEFATEPGSLAQDVVKWRDMASDYKDKYLRSLAETENLRKRLQKERQELVQYAVQNVILDFLGPIDHFENALKFTDKASGEIKNWAMGFQMILGQFKDALSSNGVTSFDSIGQPFDHTCHDAIELVDTIEYPSGTVVDESLRGYKIGGDRTLRPARVKVAKAPASDDQPEEEAVEPSDDKVS